jgi:hypothetical protein
MKKFVVGAALVLSVQAYASSPSDVKFDFPIPSDSNQVMLYKNGKPLQKAFGPQNPSGDACFVMSGQPGASVPAREGLTPVLGNYSNLWPSKYKSGTVDWAQVSFVLYPDGEIKSKESAQNLENGGQEIKIFCSTGGATAITSVADFFKVAKQSFGNHMVSTPKASGYLVKSRTSGPDSWENLFAKNLNRVENPPKKSAPTQSQIASEQQKVLQDAAATAVSGSELEMQEWSSGPSSAGSPK